MQDDYDIQMTQAVKRKVSVTCNLSKGIHEENTLSSIKNLMETLKLSMEQAMTALKIPEAERQKYIDLLEK